MCRGLLPSDLVKCQRLLAAVALVVLPLEAGAQEAPAVSAQREQGLLWRNRPSIRFGPVRIDLRLKLQFDWRAFDPDLDDEDATLFDFRVHRVGVEGEVTNHLEYEVERDVGESKSEGGKQWRDVFANWRTFRQAEVRGGRFKIPFGLEQLTGPTDTDFAYRSLASESIAPARDEGVMVHGRFLQRGFTYAVGVFDDDGDNGRLREPQFVADQGPPPEIGTAFAARVTVTPLRPLGVSALEDLRVGAAYTRADVPEGLNSLRGRTILETSTFFEPVYVNGPRQRFGLEFDFSSGPFGVRSEWMQAREAREGQGLMNQDLSDFVSTGWYLTGTWVVTGESKADGVTPRRPLFRGGFGAVELGVRYDQLELESASKEGTPLRNPRADHLLSNRDRVWTTGINWFPVRWVRITANAFHETFDDPQRTPIPDIMSYWSGLLRLQIVF
jgi:phosphate-selective porin OprO/OprP